MPQWDISTYSSQLFWLFLTFILFLLVSIFLVVPRFKRNIENRNNQIEKEGIESESNRFKATEILSSINKRFESVKSEINDKTRDEKNRLFKNFIEKRDKIRDETKIKLRSSLDDIKLSVDETDIYISEEFVNDMVSLLELKYRK